MNLYFSDVWELRTSPARAVRQRGALLGLAYVQIVFPDAKRKCVQYA